LCGPALQVTADLSDLVMGHVSWFTYTSMTRVYKHYSFNLTGQGLQGRKVGSSGSVGQAAAR
jgi:hypothetical protein